MEFVVTPCDLQCRLHIHEIMIVEVDTKTYYLAFTKCYHIEEIIYKPYQYNQVI